MHDRAFAEAGGQSVPAAAGAPVSAESSKTTTSVAGAPPRPVAAEEPATPLGVQFKQERASRDDFVRKATIGRVRQALVALGGDYDDSQLRGFDFACVPKSKLFGRSKNLRLLGRFVSQLDREAVADAWTDASKWGDAKNEDVCVLLMGTALASAGELATEIADQRRRSRATRLTLIPVDARVWDAHMPFDAPAIAKTLVARLKSGG